MRPKTYRRLAPNQISRLTVCSRDSTQKRIAYETGELIEAPNWTPDGKWLVYNGDGRLFRLSPDGETGPERIGTAPVENLNNDHVIAPDGRTIYVSAGDGHLYAVPMDGGAPEKVSNDQDRSRNFRYFLHGVSPDGNTLAYVGLEKAGDGIVTRICTLPAAGGEDVCLTDGACPVDGPEFSADGNWLYFNSEAAAVRPGHAQIFRMRPDGSGMQQLTDDERVNWFPHCAPDGSLIAYISYPPGTRGHPADKQVIIRTMTPDGQDIRDLDSFNGGQGTINVTSWAPDSRHFAYVSYPFVD